MWSYLVYYVVKNFVVDYIRFKNYIETHAVPFKQVQNPFFSFLVASPIIRTSYAISKMGMIFVFYAVIFFDEKWLKDFAIIISIIAVVVSTLRAFPPMWENIAKKL